MPYERFHDVVLTDDLPEQGLRAGDVGTVVEHHTASDREDGYSVEFFDMTGKTVAVVTLRESQLRLPTSDDVPSVRLRRTG